MAEAEMLPIIAKQGGQIAMQAQGKGDDNGLGRGGLAGFPAFEGARADIQPEA